MQHGRLIAVSMGPGDPGLITRHAWEQLSRPDTIWTYPIRSLKKESYALSIAQRAGLQMPEQHLALLFPMTHDTEILAKHWLRAAQQVQQMLEGGRDVLFLVEGDASTYASYIYLGRTLKAIAPHLQTQVIAGVNAFNAACATLQIPLSEQDDTIAIVPAAYGTSAIARMLRDFDTLVLMKVKPLLDDILNLLEAHDIAQHARFIEKAGAPEERIVHDVLSLRGEKVNYLSLMIVRNPHRQRGEMVRGCKKKTQEPVLEN